MDWIETKDKKPELGNTVIVLIDLGRGLELRFATYDIYGREGYYKPMWAVKTRTSDRVGPGGFFPVDSVARWLPVGMP
jgi:hypothetical protein